ncbi:FAD-binding domain-containing protein [Phlebopus sp. FC_14]|nr:FAD-binding domain-containing protein [Phlebopus sp. FC_14]
MSSTSSATGTSLPGQTLLLYPEKAWYIIAIFLLVVGCFQWGSLMHSKFAGRRRRMRPKRPDEEFTSPPPSAGPDKYSIRRLPLALANFYRVVAFRWTVEFGKSYTFSVAEVLVATSYVVLVLAWTFVGIRDKNFVLSPWSTRVGVVASSQLPLVTALGTKHNLVSLVTGVSYDKLNFMHRVTARTCFTLLLVHAGAEIYSFTRLDVDLHKTWLRAGITAVVALGILCVMSVRPVRAENYEFFFYTHFVAVLIFLLGGYIHTSATHESWIWPSLVIWGLDRSLRALKVVAFNYPYFFSMRGSRALDATTELLSDDFVRVKFRRPRYFRWKPGQAAYLIMPSVSRFPLETHPFSIASIDSPLFVSNEQDLNRFSPRGTADWKELVFIISVRGGFTRRLRDAAAQNKTVKVFIDGPYGPSPELGCYDTSVLIAGGSGITYTLPVFLNIIECVRNGASRCSRVVFIWAIRDADNLHWIESTLHKAHELAPPGLELSVRIFVTRGPGRTPLVAEGDAAADCKESIMTAAHWLTTESGRPDVGVILREEMERTSGRMSVNVCGSQSLARSVRGALCVSGSGVWNVLRGGPSVTLCVESFGYA